MINDLERLVNRKPEWHTRLMNAINCGLVEHELLIDDLCRELDTQKPLALISAVDHYQRRAVDELWEDLEGYKIK